MLFKILSLILLIVLIIVWYIWRKRLMTKLKRNGIPGPEPHLIFGNIKEYQTKGYAKCHEEWINKYGTIVGYYLGGKPYVLIADHELLKLIQIKDFQHFTKRTLTIDGGLNPNPRLQHSLITYDGNQWKQMRSTLTPTFSGFKLKQMTPIINSAIDKFISRVKENSEQNKEFDIYELLQGLTLDTISKTAFGVETGAQEDSENPILKAARGTFDIKVGQFLILLWLFFPELRFVINPLRILVEKIKDLMGVSDHGYLLKVSDQVVSERRKNMSNGRKDLLQLMLEAKMGEVLSNDKLAISSDMSNDSIVESREQTTKRTNMTNDEVASNAVLFFDAGYETTSTALSYIMHILINHQEIQEKIRQEVKELIEDEGKLDYNTVTKLKFMEQVVYETMRIYPPVTTFISRSPNIDYHYKDIVIPRGADCRVPLYHMHRDPELWYEPEKFDPQRFSDENKHLINPVVWQPFGVGPRNCIGMRFAMLEIKLALSQLLIKYKLVPSEKTELGDITRDFKVITMTPKYGVFTKAISIS